MAATAAAQSAPESRVAVTLGGGAQISSTTFTQAVTFEQYSEQGSLTSTYPIGRHAVVDAAGRVRVWRAIAVGLSVSYLRDPVSARIDALVPHPLVFAQPRQIGGFADSARTELATHFQAAYWAQLTPRFDIIVSGGPSIFRVDQSFVTEVTYTQTFPYDTATYQQASVGRQRKTVAGGHVEGQVGWLFKPRVGLVGGVRYSRATADFPGTSTPTLTVGGIQLLGGVSLRF
jgi:hypothetical protein